jgi:hypothetical protein
MWLMLSIWVDKTFTAGTPIVEMEIWYSHAEYVDVGLKSRFSLEDWGSMFRNVGICLEIHKALQLRRPASIMFSFITNCFIWFTL